MNEELHHVCSSHMKRSSLNEQNKIHSISPGVHYMDYILFEQGIIFLFFSPPGGLILAIIEGVGIAVNRMVSEQFKPGTYVTYRRVMGSGKVP